MGTVRRIVPGLRNEKMDIGVEQVRHYRLRGHHLDRKLSPKGLLAAAGACGVQNSPPGAWETALFNRVENCRLRDLRWALEEERRCCRRGATGVSRWCFPRRKAAFFSRLS